MSVDNPFTLFIRRIRAGDPHAAAELVRQYEPAVRLEVRVRLRDPRLRRVFDSMDICQSVLGSFFPRAAGGEYELEQPEQLLKLLVTIARNKVAYQARRYGTQGRDRRRVEALAAHHEAVAAAGPGPGSVVACRDLLEKVRQRLTSEERRAGGEGWAEIAAALGGTPRARRMQLSRAFDRVAQELGVDEADHA